MNAIPKPRPPGLRFSHAVLGLAVIHQLIGSEWMAKPWKPEGASALQVTLFELHEWVGLTAVVLLAILLVSLVRRTPGGFFRRYFPWLAAEGRNGIGREARQLLEGLRRLTPPTAEQAKHLATAVQGLGLLLLLFFAITGTAMWLLEDQLDLMHRIGSLHELGAMPLKLYLLGHAGMAVIHEWRGEGLIRRMFSLRGG